MPIDTVSQIVLVRKVRDGLSRAVRQTIQALVPTLVIWSHGDVTGINAKAVGILAGITALVSVLKSVLSWKVPASAPVYLQLAERAATAAAGTALAFITVDGTVAVVSGIDVGTVLTACVGSALLAAGMYYSNPPVVQGEVLSSRIL